MSDPILLTIREAAIRGTHQRKQAKARRGEAALPKDRVAVGVRVSPLATRARTPNR